MQDGGFARRRWTLVAIGVSILAAVVGTWPLATALGDAVPTPRWHCLGNGCEDEILCVWIVSSLAKRLLHDPLTLFEGGILYPLKHTLAYSETMLSAVAVAAPVTWLTGNHVLGYDLHYLGTVALSVLGTFLLVREVTGDPRAALVAGLLFGLTGERWNYRGHLPRVSVQWIPFVFWTWIRFLDRPGRKRGAALAAAMLANLHTSVYQGLLLPVLLVPWSLTLMAARRWPFRRWVVSIAVLAVTLAAGAVLYWPLAIVAEELSFTTAGAGTEVPNGWGWYVAALVHPVAYLQRLGTADRTITTFSPLPLLMLAVAALAAIRRRTNDGAPPGERAHFVAAIAFVVAAAAVTVQSTRLGPLGPVRDVLFALPGLSGLRGRARLDIVVAFGGALVFGIALARVLRRVRGRGAIVVATLAAAAVVVDTRTFHDRTPLTWLPRADAIPPAVLMAARSGGSGALLHIPYGSWSYETVYMMWGLVHGRPLMNGYTAVMPRFRPIADRLPSPFARRALADAGVTHVLIHTNVALGLTARAILDATMRDPSLRKVALGDTVLLTIDDAPAPPPALEGSPLPSRTWRLEGSDPGAERAADGDVGTHWTAATLGRPTSLRVDLGDEHAVTGLRLELGPHIREYPHAWEAWGSRDATTWERLGGERPTTPPFASYRRDHRAIVLDLPLQTTRVRWVELRVPLQQPITLFTEHGDGTWGVHELAVFARDEPAPAP
jgi:hypothetical protein